MLLYSSTRQAILQLIPSRWTRWAAYLGFWFLVGIAGGMNWNFFYPGGNPYTFIEALISKVDLWAVWGAITNVILWLGHRFHIAPPNRMRNLTVLILVGVVVPSIYFVPYTLHIMLFLGMRIDLATLWTQYQWVFSSYLNYWYLVFWATIGIEHLAKYYLEVSTERLHASRLESQLAQAQLHTLRGQLQPHFFFNTLNMISSLVERGQKSEALDSVRELSDLVRGSLEIGKRQHITVNEEFAFHRRYLNLMSARFSDRLQIAIDLPDNVADAELPGLILQPLVENAVKHGVAANIGEARIELSARLVDSQLHLVVTNRGRLGSSGDGTGLGLAVTRQRLEFLYGDAFSLETESAPAQAFYTASITLPWRRLETASIRTEGSSNGT